MATVIFTDKGKKAINQAILRDVTLNKAYEVTRLLVEGDETQGDSVNEPGFEFIDDAGDVVSVKMTSPATFVINE